MDTKDSKVLMWALFATGVSGIVSEYVLATLATYFLGDSVFQWTMILSIMLFSMGLGSRLSKLIDKHIVAYFIGAELLLSFLSSICALTVYSLMATEVYTEIVLYFLAVAIGLLIGLEIPLVTRINGRYQDLKSNISSVLEKDYYGSLIGGVFFAFVGLPFLGLQYTPFVLGFVNFAVAMVVFYTYRKQLRRKLRFMLLGGSLFVLCVIALGTLFAEPIILFGEQKKYNNKVVASIDTKYQKITLTKSGNNHILYLNNSMQLNTMDEWLYHEPLVHPVMLLSEMPRNILVLGGGDGCGVREILKHETVKSVKLIDLDPMMTDFGATNPVFRELNQDAYQDHRVTVVNQDAFIALEEDTNFYDAIIIDFPDPRTIELSRLYSKEMYVMCANRLKKNGLLVTQATSPYFQTQAFYCIEKTIRSTGMSTLPIHNHVQSFGEWGWVIGSKLYSTDQLKSKLEQAKIPSDLNTAWLNEEALRLLPTFGKTVDDTTKLEVNSILNPVLFKYYIKGSSFNHSFYD